MMMFSFMRGAFVMKEWIVLDAIKGDQIASVSSFNWHALTSPESRNILIGGVYDI